MVFVADSQRTMKASNAESFENLQENLMLQGIDLKEFPHMSSSSTNGICGIC